ncbi:uncharacterized protein [Mytilus edulis]|uniref:uncharacterized protein n=1 Tax=Mytilus edulis TaxID=6550 RepID=UPI0039EE6C50
MRPDYLTIISVLFYLNYVTKEVTAIDACSHISKVSKYSTNCIGILAVLNNTVHTHTDVCQIYNEVGRCIQLLAVKNGETCDMQSLHTTFTKLATYYTDDWLTALDTQSCQLEEVTESLCTSPDRLGLISAIGCFPPIIGGSLTHSNYYICSLVSSLEVCTDQFTNMLGESHCEDGKIKDGLQSSTAKQWIQDNYPKVNLDECFKVYQPGQPGGDSECKDFIYISKHTQDAMGIMYLNNITVVSQAVYCKNFYYAMHMLQHEMSKAGHTCTVPELQPEFSKILGYQGVKPSTLSECQGQMQKTTADFCQDEAGVLQVMAREPYCRPYLENMKDPKNDKCMMARQFALCSETRLQYAGFDCSKTILSTTNIGQYVQTNYGISLSSC